MQPMRPSNTAADQPITAGPHAEPPLTGLRVVDLSQVLAGPYSAWALAQLGAEVTKVEPPGGDASMQVGPFHDGTSLYHRAVNTGKKVVNLDLTSAGDRERLHDMLGVADILIQNMRAASALKLSVSPPQLLVRHPKLVIVTISGFAAGSSEAGRAAYDLVIQALSGVMSLTGTADRPAVRAGVPVSDLSAGLWAAIAGLAGLRYRDAHGRGGLLQVPMLDASLSLLTYMGADAATTGNSPGRIGNEHPSVVPYGSFEAKDGHVVVAVYSDKHWLPLCRALGLGGLGADPELAIMSGRVARRAEVNLAVQAAISDHSRAELLDLLESHDIPCAPVLELSEALATRYVKERRIISELGEDTAQYRTVSAPVKGIEHP